MTKKQFHDELLLCIIAQELIEMFFGYEVKVTKHLKICGVFGKK